MCMSFNFNFFSTQTCSWYLLLSTCKEKRRWYSHTSEYRGKGESRQKLQIDPSWLLGGTYHNCCLLNNNFEQYYSTKDSIILNIRCGQNKWQRQLYLQSYYCVPCWVASAHFPCHCMVMPFCFITQSQNSSSQDS